jgi:ferredoxin, 2Fe-2S
LTPGIPVSDVTAPPRLASHHDKGREMPKITYVHPDGAREVLDVPVGTSIMRAAIMNSIDGIVAECGGEMMCATCHVYVEEAQLDRTPKMSEEEAAMLEFTASERRPNSRLSCQLTVTPELDGLVVYLPETQV